MPLDAVNFHPLGPVKSNDLLQFYNLFTGVMQDQPITLRNALSIGGNQGLTTVPLRVYGSPGQQTNLLDLYPDRTSAQPGFGFSALGSFAWGPGGVAPQDTFMSRIALQNEHVSDTPGLYIRPDLEIDNKLTVDGQTSLKGGLLGPLNVTGNVAISGTLNVGGTATVNRLTAATGPLTFGSVIVTDAGSGRAEFNGEVYSPSAFRIGQFASLVSRRLTFQGGGGVFSDTDGQVRIVNHLSVDFDITVGRTLQVNGNVNSVSITTGTATISGNASVGAALSVGGAVSTPQINFPNGHNIQYVSGQPALQTSGHWVVAGGYLYLNGERTLQVANVGGNYIQANHHFGVVGSADYGWGFQLPNSHGTINYTRAIATAWDIHSSRDYKTGITPLSDPLAIVRNDALHAMQYSYLTPDKNASAPSLGFMAEDWLPHVPEVVGTDGRGKAVAMDYARVGAITFEALKLYMQETDARLAALEGKA